MSDTNTTPAVEIAPPTPEQVAAMLAMIRMLPAAQQAALGADLIPAAPLWFADCKLSIVPHKGKENGQVKTLRISFTHGKLKNGSDREHTYFCNLDMLALVMTRADEIRKALVASLPQFDKDCYERSELASYHHALKNAALTKMS